MKLESIKNFIIFIFQLFKTDIKVSIAKTLLSTGVILSVGGPSYNIFIETENVKANLQINNTGDILLYLGILLISIATIMLIIFYKSTSKTSYLYFSPLLKGMNDEMPIYAVDKKDKYSVITNKIIGFNPYNKEALIKKYLFLEESFSSRFDHSESNKIYMAGIGSIPYLYLLGTLLKNGHIDSQIMEFSNEKQQWNQLQPYGAKIHNIIMNTSNSIEEEINLLSAGTSNDVAIALSYSYEVFENSIPSSLKNNTLYLKNSLGIGLYLLNSVETQYSLIDELLQYIHRLSKNGKKVHLFISAQASFCVNFGKRYQDNVTGTVVLHNYNSDSKKYEWSIEFNKDICK